MKVKVEPNQQNIAEELTQNDTNYVENEYEMVEEQVEAVAIGDTYATAVDTVLVEDNQYETVI